MATQNATTTKADEALHKALDVNARECESADRKRDRAYSDRINLWRRAIDAGWTQARIAAAARTTEGAVTQALRRARLSDR